VKGSPDGGREDGYFDGEMNRESNKQAGSPKNGVRRVFEAVTRTAKGEGECVSRRMISNGRRRVHRPTED
jgi:hypothetical protein